MFKSNIGSKFKHCLYEYKDLGDHDHIQFDLVIEMLGLELVV